MLNPFGKFILVGVPETPLPAIHAFSLIQGGRFLGGSAIGSKLDAISMFKLVAEKNIKPWYVLFFPQNTKTRYFKRHKLILIMIFFSSFRIEVLPMKEVKKAVDGVWTGKPRYRYVLEQDITA